MSRLRIRFEFEGVKYECDPSAYDQDLIRLPDGRILAMNTWFESNPPQPGELHVVTEVLAGKVPAEAVRVG